jgi:hypothetical protein
MLFVELEDVVDG